MANKKVPASERRIDGRQTAGRAVINALKEANAFDEASAVGYDVLKDINLTTPVLAYTIANLMEENVIIRTEDEKYYYSDLGWKKMELKVTAGYSMLFIIPVVALALFWLLSKFVSI